MSKSVYSIVLMDEVVSKIDAIAYQNSTSRSNMINRILAEYAGLTTHEQHKADIFLAVENFINTQSILQLLNVSEAMMLMRSALAYKYNPSLRYTIELAPQSVDYLALFKVQLRSQSSALLSHLEAFYRLWDNCEKHSINSSLQSVIENGRYARRLRLPNQQLDTITLGDAIAHYVANFDECMKCYFSHLPDEQKAKTATAQLYIANSNRQTDFL